ncbi:FKBP-type peptidyl-prolyl cis-trans isomerase [Parahaliea aestuarii]|uniref:Peptidyl-prolyl cis-trans isomerase n=1 Tax=Parahaliea aestuarii TaxID=1852021 RepID=A0A5C8ZYP0_9GAMM|nr:peptidylprolyl isomerase [Parahaliea aestuarii]TXS92527.1 peptidylprolyl isomerase [Parahaliea aestuarii]
MNISKNSVATFHYILRDEQGNEMESSGDGEPSAYLHGASNIIPGLEAALEGKTAGDHVEVTLAPADAYGERLPEREQKVPVKHLLFNGKLRPGMVVQVNTQEGRHPVTVLKVGRHSATVDTNHPLAGQALTFVVDIVDVRAATQEEIDHGHAHGVGGHHH